MRGDVKVAVLGAATAIVLAGASTMAMAAAAGALGHGRLGPAGQVTTCTTPALPGTVIDVTLVDMGRMGHGQGGGMMGAGAGPMMNGGWGAAGMMTVRVSPTSATSGTVSFRVANAGALTHELIVLPLSPGAHPGQRAVGADGTVDETGSVGEASNTCGSDEGDGILPGGRSWTSPQLSPGRYELLCNLPGHYAAGMFAELDVTTT